MSARISAFLVALALAVTGLAAAQETTGSIGGTVVDAQGLAVPGATVTVTGPQGARTSVTDAAGHYVAPFLTPGTACPD
jgi:cytochrome oxidase Cu insertion factor (SCO1/SenC/PrrC family)